MNSANPLWGAPRIHGELLKLGIEVSQATVAKYMVRRIGTPSPTWRSFLRNEAIGIAAIDMFVAVSVSFRLLYVMIILAHGRRKIVRFDVTQHPTAAWLAQQVIEAFPWETALSFLLRDRDGSYGASRRRLDLDHATAADGTVRGTRRFITPSRSWLPHLPQFLLGGNFRQGQLA
jgi:hypothetical protein